ncbi:MAG: cache domain-containing protein [bacterium]
MPSASVKKGKLFYKLLIIFLVISLGPLGIAGYYLINLSQTTLSRSILRDQESLAVGFADTVFNYVMSFRNILFDASRLEDFSPMNAARQRAIINHMMQLHAAFLEMSVVDAAGNETVRIGRFLREPQLRNLSDNVAFTKTLKTGEFIGGLDRFMDSYPMLTIGLQIVNPATSQAAGALMAKLSLNGLSSILKTGFPEATHTQAAVIDGNGFLVAHSDLAVVYKPDAKLPDDVLRVLLQNDAKTGGGEIPLADGEKALGAFAEVQDLGWVVYVQRSLTIAHQTSREMLKRTYRTMVMVVVFVLLLGYIVSAVITQPIQALREAAIKLGQGQFDDLPEVRMPNDEIGELARTFSQMSDSLRVKTVEITASKEELEKLNRTLENRVEARTRELKAAQDELIKKERLAAIGQMASVVGHEIRNPLAVINNSVYFIKTKLGGVQPPPDPKVIKHISIIESEIQQANGIINEILGFARTKELNPRIQSLNSFMDELLASYPFPPHITVVKNAAPENPMVNIDSGEMKQALRNLIGNGIEVMPSGGTLRIVTEMMQSNWVRIDVADTGPGMPRDTAEKVFTPFSPPRPEAPGLAWPWSKRWWTGIRGKWTWSASRERGRLSRFTSPLRTGLSGRVTSNR